MFKRYTFSRFQQYINNKTGYTPLPFKSGVSSAPKTQSKVQKVTKAKAKPAKQTSLHNKNVISSIIAEKAKLSQEVKLERQGGKIKPKLKAEVKLKSWKDDENEDPVEEPQSCADVTSEESVVREPAKVWNRVVSSSLLLVSQYTFEKKKKKKNRTRRK